MLRAYRAGAWDLAEQELARCRALAEPHDLARLYNTYAEHIRRHRLDASEPGWKDAEKTSAKP
jgi:hypothetical protein